MFMAGVVRPLKLGNMAEEHPENSSAAFKASGFIRASRHYVEMYPLRAAIQGIPTIGGPLDTLLAGAGANWQAQRLEAFIHDLTQQLEKINQSVPELTPDEPLYDFVKQVFDEVIRHRSEEKRKRFANIVIKQVIERHPWEEAETAARFMADLTEQHVEVLTTVADAPICTETFEGLRVVALIDWRGESTPKQPPLDLREVFPNLSVLALRMYCSELMARGLLHDEGIGRADVLAFEYLRPTELGDWFISWVRKTASSGESV